MKCVNICYTDKKYVCNIGGRNELNVIAADLGSQVVFLRKLMAHEDEQVTSYSFMEVFYEHTYSSRN